MAKRVDKDAELDFIMDEVTAIALQPAGVLKPLATQQKQTNKKEKVTDMNKEQYNKAKADHKAEIAKLKNNIKRHKLLMKQAKIAYKLGAMKET
jgi:HD superfamily phosphodiesterase